MRYVRMSVAVALAGLSCLVAYAEDAAEPNTPTTQPAVPSKELGAPAGALQIAQWVKGTKVEFKPGGDGHIYVVEFWATWCGPCKASIPHLTELQKKYGDKVTFIGVSGEELDTVKKFVDEMAGKMAYTVAVDDDGKTSAAYMDAYAENGIPHAFIVDGKGRVIWHDHPMADDFGTTLDQVVAGKFDLADAQKMAKQHHELEQHREEALPKVMEYVDLVGNEDVDHAKAADAGAAVFTLLKDDAEMLDKVAWHLLTDENVAYRDMDLVLKLIKRANELTEGKNASVLDTYAYALSASSKFKEAIEMEKKAIALETNAEQLESYRQRLAEYEQKATEGGGATSRPTTSRPTSRPSE